jgi:hypothetical protein
VPTNPHGHTIDLAFSNIPGAKATVEDHLQTTSNHFTINITLPTRPKIPTVQGRRKVKDLDRFNEIIKEEATHFQYRTARSSKELDDQAQTLINLFNLAILSTSNQPRCHTLQAPWWTEECAEAHLEYTATVRTGLSELALGVRSRL